MQHDDAAAVSGRAVVPDEPQPFGPLSIPSSPVGSDYAGPRLYTGI